MKKTATKRARASCKKADLHKTRQGICAGDVLTPVQRTTRGLCVVVIRHVTNGRLQNLRQWAPESDELEYQVFPDNNPL